MKKKYTYFIILFFFSSLVYSNDKDKRSEYLNILDQEINEIVRLSKSVGRKNPTVFVRMMYVFIQKGKLLKEQENEKFLRISPKKRIDLDKRRFFKKSEKNFKKNSSCSLTCSCSKNLGSLTGTSRLDLICNSIPLLLSAL